MMCKPRRETIDVELGIDYVTYHPLQTDLPVPFPSSYWVIPGRLLAGEYPGAKDAYEASRKLKSLLDSGICQIMNLMQVDETGHQGEPFVPYDDTIADLANRSHCAVTCMRYPIKDLSIPASSRMIDILDTIDRALENRKSTYIHCWGGVGRTGTVVGCFLMRHGLATKDNVIEVVKRLREKDAKAHRSSPETHEQRDFVSSWLEYDKNSPTSLKRYLGCMLGGAIGDALGAPVEFSSLSHIRQKYGPAGITDYDKAYGRIGAITDDTQMTLFTAEGLLRAWTRGTVRGICSIPSVVHHAYVQWVNTQGEQSQSHFNQSQTGFLNHVPELRSRRAPGNSCLSALRKADMGTMESPINDSKGCGGVMRVAPVGLIAENPESAFRLGCEIAAITHGHPLGYLTAGALAAVINSLKIGTPLDESIDLALNLLKRQDTHIECIELIQRAIDLAEESKLEPDAIEALGGGWVAEEALAISLYCSLGAQSDFARGVLAAVNHSGDSDSTGAITGSLLGCMNGVSRIPRRWIEPLELREIIETLGIDLFIEFRSDDKWFERYTGY